MKKIIIPILLLMMLVLTGCNRENTPIICKASSDSQDADKLVEQYITAINDSNIESLLTCVDAYDKRETGLRRAIDNYKLYFNNQPIESYEFLQKTSDDSGTYYIYSISNESGKNKRLKLERTTAGLSVGFDNFIRYSEFAEQKMSAFVEALKKSDAKDLAFNIWNSMEPINSQGDIGIYPIGEAQKVLQKYQEYFDIGTISFKFTGDTSKEDGDGYFIYEILDKGDKKHKVIIIFGDGQVGIEDDWIAKMDQKQTQGYDILDSTGKVIPYSK